MERSWWWKAALYAVVTVLAVLYLIPTVVPENKQPSFIKKYFEKRIELGLDLQGGLHLVYEVNVDKAVSGKVDRLASDIEDRLHKDKGVAELNVNREGRDDITLTFKPPADEAKLDDSILKEYRKTLDVVSRDASTGVVKLRLDPDQIEDIRDYALRQAIETIRGRVDKFGVSEPTIIKKGTDIIVELPGLKPSDFERIKSIIGRTAQLEFKIVDDGSEYMRKVAAAVPKGSGIEVLPESWTEKDTGKSHEDVELKSKSRETLEKFFAGLTGDLALPDDHEIGYEEVQARNESGEATPDHSWRTYYLHKRAPLTGEYLANAEQTWDQQTGRPEISYEMDRQGGVLNERLTSENVGRKMAILLDDQVKSAPVIESRIGARGRITLGGFGDPMAQQQEAKDLVSVLRSGALPAPLHKTFETQVGPTMGRDAIQKAKVSMYIGAAAVVLFMLIYYRLSGIIAVVAMVLNMLYMIAILAAFEASLTLPGIAGLVLTIGMAVDANIIIYERIREELRTGKSVRTAVDTGFSRAFWTVFDAHVTNFVAGVVLYSYGSGPIRGFAVTLLVGIITNLFTSYWLSHWMFDGVVGRRGSARATLSI
ncbi:MAG TPA: protein translocase subunit SecD [Polyangia bacterium]|jgi:preprotein translocase subunit SecD|nr:protein translocase subunit SecD [Polyangia bacterium]